MDEFETQDIPCGRTLTYNEFFERFNTISRGCGHHACPATVGGEFVGVAIVSERDNKLMAILDVDSFTWDFKESAFHWQELNLMMQLAANMPEFRGEINDD